MKRNYLALSLITLLFSTVSFADHGAEHDRTWSKTHRYAVAIDPVSWVGGNFRFAFEGSFNDRMSIYLPMAFGIEKSIFNNTYYQGTYFAAQMGVKYYVTGKSAYQGFYVSPLLGFFFGQPEYAAGVKLTGQHTTGGLSYGFNIGYAWNIWKGLWVDGSLGWEGIVTTFNSDTNNQGHGGRSGLPGTGGFPATYTGFVPQVSMMVGYNW